MADVRLINIAPFEKTLERQTGQTMHSEDILAALANCPEVDAVEVVRCAECTKSGCCIIEERLVTARAKDRYCGLGERREGE